MRVSVTLFVFTDNCFFKKCLHNVKIPLVPLTVVKISVPMLKLKRKRHLHAAGNGLEYFCGGIFSLIEKTLSSPILFTTDICYRPLPHSNI